jgi:hypothetical protein
MHGSISGVWKRGMAQLMRHRQTKGPETDRPRLNHRATPRLYRFSAYREPLRGKKRGSVRIADNPGGTPERERATHENHEYEVQLETMRPDIGLS